MTLQILWFCLIAVFWGGYFVLEGFDFGVGILLPFLPRDEEERGEMFRSIGPVWDGDACLLLFAFVGGSCLRRGPPGILLGGGGRAARTLGVRASAVGAAFLIWWVVVAVDKTQKGVFPPVLPAVIAIGAFALA